MARTQPCARSSNPHLRPAGSPGWAARQGARLLPCARPPAAWRPAGYARLAAVRCRGQPTWTGWPQVKPSESFWCLDLYLTSTPLIGRTDLLPTLLTPRRHGVQMVTNGHALPGAWLLAVSPATAAVARSGWTLTRPSTSAGIASCLQGRRLTAANGTARLLGHLHVADPSKHPSRSVLQDTNLMPAEECTSSKKTRCSLI